METWNDHQKAVICIIEYTLWFFESFVGGKWLYILVDCSNSIFQTNFRLNGGNKAQSQTTRMNTMRCLFGIDLIFHDQSSRALLE